MSNIANVFKSDIFSMTTMTAFINHIPVEPLKLGQILEFEEKGINTVAAAVEEQDGKLRVLQSSERGSAAQASAGKKRRVRHFDVPHYTEQAVVHASEIQGSRAFGSTNVFETAEGKRNEKLTDCRNNHEITAEFARTGAITGVLRDADGSIIQDWHDGSGFNVARTEHEIDITDTKTDLRVALIQAKRKAEIHLGGYMVRGYKLFFTAEMFDAFIGHASIKTMYERYLEGAHLRDDPRRGFKVIEGVEVFSYDINNVGSVEFMPTDTGFLVPDAPGLLKGRFAPADTLETANTDGVPFYALTTEVTPRAWKGETESNVLYFCEKPASIANIKWK